MKKIFAPIISVIVVVTLFLLFSNLNLKSNTSVTVLKDKNNLKEYYERLLKVPEPQFSEYQSDLSAENTTINLLLYHKYGIPFDSNVGFNEASKVFDKGWNELSRNTDATDDKVHIAYYYIVLAKELDAKVPHDTKKNIVEFYENYIKNDIGKKYVSKTVELCVEDRLSFIGEYLSKDTACENIVNVANQKLLRVVLKNYSDLGNTDNNIENLMNRMYSVSALSQLRYKGEMLSEDSEVKLCSFIDSADFENMNYYERAIFLNKFLMVYKKSRIPFDLNAKCNNIFAVFKDNPMLASSLRLECINLFSRCEIGDNWVKTYLEGLAHNANYGFYKYRLLVPTFRNVYYSVQVEKMLGTEEALVNNYIDTALKKVHANSDSYEEMYYLLLLSKSNSHIENKLMSAGSSSIDKAKDYIAAAEITEQNFMQYYYAVKILLESGNSEFAEKYHEKIKKNIDILRQKYGDSQDFIYIDALCKDILSYYPDKYPKPELIWKDIFDLKPNTFYLDTIKLYVEIANRLNIKPASNDAENLRNILKEYSTDTGYCPFSNEEYTTLLSTYCGLYIEYYSQKYIK